MVVFEVTPKIFLDRLVHLTVAISQLPFKANRLLCTRLGIIDFPFD